MKNKTAKMPLCLLFVQILFLHGCSEELEFFAHTGAKPIVYCLLDPADSVHYLRISQSFIPEGQDWDLKPDPDSLVYNENYYAYLVKDLPDQFGKPLYFSPVEDISKKDSGYFPDDKLKLLQVKAHLKTGERYSLYVHSPDLPNLISASTIIIPPVRILDPNPLPGKEITILPDQGYDLRLSHPAKYAIYQPFIRINYQEGDSLFQENLSVVLPLSPVYSYTESALVKDFINGNNFYNLIIEHLSAPPTGKLRKMISLDLIAWAGGEELAILTQSDNEHNTPVGAPGTYSNLDGAEGVFSCRVSSTSNNNQFSDITINFLAKSDKTNHLGFLANDEDF